MTNRATEVTENTEDVFSVFSSLSSVSSVLKAGCAAAGGKETTVTWDEDDETGAWKVVLNHEEQYSIWPAEGECPSGWREAGVSGTRAECLAHIDEAWTDMRPASLRARLAATNQDQPPAK